MQERLLQDEKDFCFKAVRSKKNDFLENIISYHQVYNIYFELQFNLQPRQLL